MRTGNTFRYTVGMLAIIGGLLGFFALYIWAVPVANKDPLLLALGVVLGWGGSVVQSEFGSTSSGRQLAATNAAIVSDAAATPAVQPVVVQQPAGQPIPVEQQP